MDKILDLYRKEIEKTSSMRFVLKSLMLLKYETIRWFINKGYSGRSIANKLGVSNSRVSQIIKLVEQNGRQ